MKNIQFIKMHGLGNDFVIIDNSENVIEDLYNRIDKEMFDKIYFFDDNYNDK